MDNLAVSNKAAKVRREYHQNWRKKNKERVRKYNAAYWERKAVEREQQANNSEVKKAWVKQRNRAFALDVLSGKVTEPLYKPTEQELLKAIINALSYHGKAFRLNVIGSYTRDGRFIVYPTEFAAWRERYIIYSKQLEFIADMQNRRSCRNRPQCTKRIN